MIEGRKYRVVPKWGKRDNDVLGNYEREWKPTVCEERGSQTTYSLALLKNWVWCSKCSEIIC